MQASELANYKSPEGAARYNVRYRTHLHKRLSDRIERRLLARLLLRIGRQPSLLDVPCGTGRLSPVLRAATDRLLESDVSLEMLRVNRGNIGETAAGRVCGSALALPYRDRAVAGVVSIRLTHHLDRPEEVARLVGELTRVAAAVVIVTYFSHHSFKNWLRLVRVALTGKRPKNTVRTATLRALAERHGFRLEASVPLSRLFSGHRFAILRRR